MFSHLRRFRCALSPLLLLALTSYFSAQGQPAQTQPIQTQAAQTQPVYESATVMRATTRMVVVDVVATDRSGNPVTDLKPGDFTVLEDGSPQQVRSFNFQHPAEVAASAVSAALPAPQLPEHVFTNVPAYRAAGPLNVILVDALNSTLLNQMNVREEMFKLLLKLPPGRPVAIYALGEKLQILQDFTSDPKILRDALTNYKDHAPQQLKNPVGDPIARSIMLSRLPGMVLAVLLKADQNAATIGADMRVALTLDALQSIAHSLSAYPGRKNLIWLSASFPLSLNVDGRMKLRGEASERNYEPQLARMADSLMNAQVAVYPVDARGIATLSFLAMSGAGRHPLGGGYSDGSGVGIEPVAADLSDELLAAHATMNTLAERTGGKAFYNTNDLDKAVLAGMDDGATYYTLGYYPTSRQWDGKFRKIQIKTARADVKLRYRSGYFAIDPAGYPQKDPKLRAHDLIQALSLESPAATALLFQARVLPPSEKTGNKVLVDFAVDPHALSFQHGDDGLEHAMMKCAVEVYSDKGVPLRTEASDISTALKPDAYNQVLRANLPCRASFNLEEGNYLLRLAVRDERTGLIGSQNAELAVGAKE
ncbi:MAG TPA: VWA domain-containing protein [Candidatus Angelobacter sp.]|nr:VWA domain-containing protein [Candidatus Angelobacter sp.]